MALTIKLKSGLIRLNFWGMALIFFYCRDLFYLAFERVLKNGAISEGICLGLMYGFLLAGLAKRPAKFKMDTVLLIGSAAVLFLFTYVAHPDYRYAIVELPTWNAFDSVFSFSKGIFAYLFFRYLNDKELMRKTLVQCAYILLFWCFMRIASSASQGGFSRATEDGTRGFASYDMLLGYRLLFVAIIFGVEFFRSNGMKKALYGALSVVSVVCMMIYGARTATASLVVFWGLRTLFCTGKHHTRRKIAVIMLGTVGVMVLMIPGILQAAGAMLARLGVQSRILNTLIAGEVSLDLGRQRMWTQAVSMIQEHPILGAGIFADRAQMGIYCHQLFLEVFLDFGVGLGFVLLVALAVLCFRSLRAKDLEWRLLFVMFFSLCFVRLMLSSSFWVETNFWAMIAIAVNIRADEKKKARIRACV